MIVTISHPRTSPTPNSLMVSLIEPTEHFSLFINRIFLRFRENTPWTVLRQEPILCTELCAEGEEGQRVVDCFKQIIDTGSITAFGAGYRAGDFETPSGYRLDVWITFEKLKERTSDLADLFNGGETFSRSA